MKLTWPDAPARAFDDCPDRYKMIASRLTLGAEGRFQADRLVQAPDSEASRGSA
jgi:hypothetical protein